MVNSQFVGSVIHDIVAPGVEKLMSSPFFAELQQRQAVNPSITGLVGSALLAQ